MCVCEHGRARPHSNRPAHPLVAAHPLGERRHHLLRGEPRLVNRALGLARARARHRTHAPREPHVGGSFSCGGRTQAMSHRSSSGPLWARRTRGRCAPRRGLLARTPGTLRAGQQPLRRLSLRRLRRPAPAGASCRPSSRWARRRQRAQAPRRCRRARRATAGPRNAVCHCRRGHCRRSQLGRSPLCSCGPGRPP